MSKLTAQQHFIPITELPVYEDALANALGYGRPLCLTVSQGMVRRWHSQVGADTAPEGLSEPCSEAWVSVKHDLGR